MLHNYMIKWFCTPDMIVIVVWLPNIKKMKYKMLLQSSHVEN